MKIKFAQVVKDIHGFDIKDERGKETSLGTLCVNALLAAFAGEEHLRGDEKFKRWKLAQKIKSSNDVLDMSIDEMSSIDELCARAYSPAVYGPIKDLLENH